MKEHAIVSSRGFASLLVSAAFATAQCTTTAVPGPGVAPGGQIFAMTEVDPDGDGPLPPNLVVGGDAGVWQWDATSQTWSSLGAGFAGSVYVLIAMPNGDIVAGAGNAQSPARAVDLRRFDGANWSPLLTTIGDPPGVPFEGSIAALHVLPEGDLLVGGDFTSIDGVAAAGLASWNGTSWTEYAGGVGGVYYRVSKFGELANGDLVVGGQFATAGGVSANNIATWDGSTFSPLGGGLANPGPFAAAPTVTGIVTRANGDLFVCGMFQDAGGVAVNSVATWDGGSWSAMGAGLGGPSIYSGFVTSAEELPNGDLVVGGASATAGVFDGTVHRWTGTAWQPESTTLGQVVRALRMTRERLVVGGDQLWELATSCPAQAAALGAACPSSGGANQLFAETLPWTGSTFRMTAAGLPPLSLIAIDGGFAPLGPVTLASLGLPVAPPACMLHIAPAYFEFALATTGQYSFDWNIPNDPIFAGTNIYWQFVVFEIDLAFQFLETTSTNALELTIGSY